MNHASGAQTLSSNQLGRETLRIRKENHQLIEENNLLKLKIDILLDMVSLLHLLSVVSYVPKIVN